MVRARRESRTKPQTGFRCTYAEQCKCEETFQTQENASCHAILAHNVPIFHRAEDRRYICPFAKELGCTVTFQFTAPLEEHLNSVHPGKGFSCPLAENYGCTSTFTSREGARNHVKAKHRNIRYPCPWAKRANCAATFQSTGGANSHVKEIHMKMKVPCPLANQENCDKTFSNMAGATSHANAVHRKLRYTCPLAKEYNCSKQFSRPGDARAHSKSHLKVEQPCPAAEDHGCKAVFKSERGAKDHVKIHTHPFLCPRQGCFARFATTKDTLEHADDQNHRVQKFFLCPLPMCKKAVVGKRLTESGMKEHKKSHIRLDDIGTDVNYVPQQVEELRLHSDLLLYSMILQQDGLDLINEVKGHESLEELVDKDGDLNIEDADFEGTFTASESDNEEQNSSTLSSQEDQELSTFGNGILSKEHRLRILEQNTNRWNSNKHLKVSFVNLGLTCLGPTSNSGLFVSERCPNEVIIDLDTAHLVLRRRPKSQLILDNRCVACRFYNQVTTFLTRYEIELEDENAVCTFHGCDQLSFHKSGRCAQHLSNIISKSYREKTTVDIRLLRETFNSAARKRWEFPPYYNTVRQRISEILQGKRAGSDLVILDDEFSPASNQVWEFAIVERVSGKVLINTTIEHKDGLDHSTWGDHPFLKMMSRSKAAQVFSPFRIRDIGRINVDEIASKLQEAGITQDTIILVYHKSPFDLRILRGFLESAGYHGILPPDENCIPLLQLLRANLSVAPPGYKGFPLALEVLFPIMYPRHQLVGLNHQALEDCQQTRLVCMAFDQLCKPIAERGEEWQPDSVANSAQTSILDWLQPTRKADDSKETCKRKHSLIGKEGAMSKRLRSSKRVDCS